MLEQFVYMIVQASKAGVSMGVLRASLLRQGMDEEEVSLLIDIVILEVRNPPTQKYKEVHTPCGQIVDVVI